MLNGENSILSKAKLAREENKKSTEIEKIQLAYLAAKVTGKGKVETSNFNNELKLNFNDNEELKETINYWYYKKYRISKDGDIEEKLPKEYQEVEYLESTGTQYIDTNIQTDFAKDISIKAEFIKPNSTGRVVIVGSFVTAAENNQALSLEVTNERNIRLYMQRSIYSSISNLLSSEHIPINTKIKTLVQYSASNSTVYLTYEFNGDTYTNSLSNLDMVSSGVIVKPLRLFLDYRQSPQPIANPLKISRLVISQDEGSLGDFIPCYRKSDNKPGMYDLVTNTFYTNAGTGEFLLGADV